MRSPGFFCIFTSRRASFIQKLGSGPKEFEPTVGADQQAQIHYKFYYKSNQADMK